jgi:cytochrome c peroxidase
MRLIGVLLFISLICACESDHLVESTEDTALIRAIRNSSSDGTLEHFVLPASEDYAAIPQEPRNPLNDAKVQLGQMLFYETALGEDALYESGLQSYSCASCHLASAGFKPGSMQGIGDGGLGIGINGEGRLQNPLYEESELDVQGIRPLAVLNTAFVPNTLWNGQFGATDKNEGLEDIFGVHIPETKINELGLQGLEAQNIEGLVLHRMKITPEYMEQLGYKDLFDEAFPDFEGDERYSLITGSFAISAFLRTQISNQAAFQKWLRGDYLAMSESEKRGALVFFEKGNCAACHSERNLGSNRFFALGVNDMDMQPSYNRNPLDAKNYGRGGFTGNPEDFFKFKVPQLYNVGDNPFYFHGSSLTTLEDVVDYFDRAEPQNPRVPNRQIASQFKPLNLTDQEKADLVSFLKEGLRDPNLDRYVPDQVLSGNCFPNNDVRSQQDMGCH